MLQKRKHNWSSSTPLYSKRRSQGYSLKLIAELFNISTPSSVSQSVSVTEASRQGWSRLTHQIPSCYLSLWYLLCSAQGHSENRTFQSKCPTKTLRCLSSFGGYAGPGDRTTIEVRDALAAAGCQRQQRIRVEPNQRIAFADNPRFRVPSVSLWHKQQGTFDLHRIGGDRRCFLDVRMARY